MHGRRTRNSRFFLYNIHACYEDMTVWAKATCTVICKPVKEGTVEKVALMQLRSAVGMEHETDIAFSFLR